METPILWDTPLCTLKVGGPRQSGHPKKRGPSSYGTPQCTPKVGTPPSKGTPQKAGAPILWGTPMRPQSVGTPILRDTPLHPKSGDSHPMGHPIVHSQIGGDPNPKGHPNVPPNFGHPNPKGHPPFCTQKVPLSSHHPLPPPRRCHCILGRPLGPPHTRVPHTYVQHVSHPTRGHLWCHLPAVPPSSCCVPPQGGGCGVGTVWGPTAPLCQQIWGGGEGTDGMG